MPVHRRRRSASIRSNRVRPVSFSTPATLHAGVPSCYITYVPKIEKNEVTGGMSVAGPLMREAVMGSAGTGDEKLGPDAVRGGELADEDLEGVTGGCINNPIAGSAAKEDAPAANLFGSGA
jgi:hypothetical protein